MLTPPWRGSATASEHYRALATVRRPSSVLPMGEDVANSATTGKAEKPKRTGKHLFQPGQSGNPKGRPIGSRQKLSEGFINALSEDFAQHGKATIRKMREEKPDAYVRVVADMVPKDVNLNVSAQNAFLALFSDFDSDDGDDE